LTIQIFGRFDEMWCSVGMPALRAEGTIDMRDPRGGTSCDAS
jgi:hypothetical protein